MGRPHRVALAPPSVRVWFSWTCNIRVSPRSSTSARTAHESFRPGSWDVNGIPTQLYDPTLGSRVSFACVARLVLKIRRELIDYSTAADADSCRAGSLVSGELACHLASPIDWALSLSVLYESKKERHVWPCAGSSPTPLTPRATRDCVPRTPPLTAAAPKLRQMAAPPRTRDSRTRDV